MCSPPSAKCAALFWNALFSEVRETGEPPAKGS